MQGLFYLAVPIIAADVTFVIEERRFVTRKVTNDTLYVFLIHDILRPYQTGKTFRRRTFFKAITP